MMDNYTEMLAPPQGTTLLEFIMVCQNGDIIGLQRILDHFMAMRLNATQISGFLKFPQVDFFSNAVGEACRHNHLHILKFLANHKATRDLINFDDSIDSACSNSMHNPWRYRRPLFIACYFNHPEIVRFLLQFDEVDVNSHLSQTKSCLHIACERGYALVVKELLRHGAKLNYNITTGSPFHLAAYNNHFHILKMLLPHTPDYYINSCSEILLTPLAYAVVHGNWPMFELLLKHRAINVNICTKEPALKFAMETSNWEMFLRLCRHPGFNTSAINLYTGDNVIQMATKIGNPRFLKYLLQLVPRADVNRINCKTHLTALDLAIHKKHSECQKALLQFSAQTYKKIVNKSTNNCTPKPIPKPKPQAIMCTVRAATKLDEVASLKQQIKHLTRERNQALKENYCIKKTINALIFSIPRIETKNNSKR